MAVIKLNNKEPMAKQGKRKASMKDVVHVLGGLIQDIEDIKSDLQMTNGTLDLYIAYKKDGNQFKDFIDNAIKTKDNTDELQEIRQDNPISITDDSKD